MSCWAHNPKVGGSNPPPATTYRFSTPHNPTIRARELRRGLPRALTRQRLSYCCSDGESLGTLSSRPTTLLLASRFDSINALPYTSIVVET
jgi:hypothetical protein